MKSSLSLLSTALVCLVAIAALLAPAAALEAGAGGKEAKGAASEGYNFTKLTSEQLKALPLWPPVAIRALLAGEVTPGAPTNSSFNASDGTPNVDLLFILQSATASFEPNKIDGSLVGGKVILSGVQETVVSFADRPFRTFDSIPLAEFFNYTLVQDFFGGPNPPNVIIAGELPSDVIAATSGTSAVLPYRRLLGGVLGTAYYNPLEPSLLKFDLPAGADGKVQILDKSVFDRFAKANNASAALSDPRLLQVTIFID